MGVGKVKVLEAIGIQKKFGKNEVLHSIDISLVEGEIVGFVGPNGAGKSTFIKSILGLYHIDSGLIKICDYDVQKDFENALKKKQKTPPRRKDNSDGDKRIDKSQNRAGFQSFIQTLQITCTHILSTIGRHCRPHGIKRAHHKHTELTARSHGSYGIRSDPVHCALQDNASDCRDRIL